MILPLISLTIRLASSTLVRSEVSFDAAYITSKHKYLIHNKWEKKNILRWIVILINSVQSIDKNQRTFV